MSKHYAEYSTTLPMTSNMMLEPRLQEYLKKRKLYKQSGYVPSVPLEREFSITNTDKKLLNAYLKGNLDIYEKEQYDNLISKKQKTKSFPSSNFVEDSRVLKSDKQPQKLPSNRGMFVPDKNNRYYDDPIVETNKTIFDSRDFAEDKFKGFDIFESKFNPTFDPKINPGYEKYDKCDSQYRISDKSIYDECKYKNKNEPQRNDFNHNVNRTDPHETFLNYDLIDDYKTNMDRIKAYAREKTNKPKQKQPKMKKHPDATYYKHIQEIDADIETELLKGMPNMRPKNRSYGYRNPAENYFDYIDEDFQNPDNTDLWPRGGSATRLDNTVIAKNRTYVREMM